MIAASNSRIDEGDRVFLANPVFRVYKIVAQLFLFQLLCSQLTGNMPQYDDLIRMARPLGWDSDSAD